MALPIITIGLTLASAGLKVFGGESKLVEFAAHPLDILAGHLAAENVEELGNRVREWYSQNEHPESDDIERAVARSGVMASLFCLLDALPIQEEPVGPLSRLGERFRKWLPQNSVQGVLSQGEQAAIRGAIENCNKRLKEIDERNYSQAAIDPLRLAMPEHTAALGKALAEQALLDLLRENPELPDRLRILFKDRWFAYLCLAFQEQIKTEPRVRRAFMILQTATGFLRIEDAVREEAVLTRQENRAQHDEVLPLIREAVEILRLLPSIRQTPLSHTRPRVFTLPCGRSLIQGRDAQIEVLRRALLNDSRQAILGPPGIGKSQLAIEYAYRYADQYDGVFWCSGKTEDNLAADWRKLSKALDLFSTDDFSALRDAVRHRLESHSEAWLLIVDAIETPGWLQPFLPRIGYTHLLITAPDRDLEELRIRNPLHLEELKPPKAAEFLLMRTSRTTADEAEQAAAGELADEKLGGFPLALEQAGAYITKTRCTFADYLTEFEAKQLSLLERGTPSNYDGSLLGALSQTVLRLSAAPGALAAARLLAVLDEESIPRRFLSAAAAAYDEQAGTNFFPTKLDPLAFDEILVPLFEFSLIREGSSEHGYRMHNLIRLGIRNLTPPEMRPGLEDAAVQACSVEVGDIDVLSELGPGPKSNYGLRTAQLAMARDIRSVEAARLLRNVGHRLLGSGGLETGWQMVMRSMEILSAEYGPRSPQLAPTLLIVAAVEKGPKSTTAEHLYSDILDIADPASQQDVIAVAQNGLAEIYREQRRFREAEQLLKATLAIRKKLVGAEHPAVATALNNLGNLHGAMGCAGDSRLLKLAATYYKSSYEMRKRLLQAPHPHLANSMNNLGWIYMGLRWWKKAEPMLKAALEMWEALYGPEHAEVLTTLRNLSRFYRATKQHAQAAEVDQRLSRIEHG